MEKKKSKKLMEQVQMLLSERGQKAFEIAKKTILQEKIKYEPMCEALHYFMKETWYDVQHPALISLTCEAVGGNPEAMTQIGAAMILLAGSADIHDDIIDKSEIKDSKPTVLGKFNKDVALLVGDALLFIGLTLLHEACEKLPRKQGQTILDLTKQAFFEIASAEAKEAGFKGKYDLTPEQYYKVIEMKAAAAEANARIGAILGGGNPKEIDALGHYGRTLGILMTIRDDFIDMFEPDELSNRAKNECLPLPILYAFRDTRKKSEIARLLMTNNITEQETQKILNLIIDMKEVQELKKQMQMLVKKSEHALNCIKRNRKILKLLLQSTLEDL